MLTECSMKSTEKKSLPKTLLGTSNFYKTLSSGKQCSDFCLDQFEPECK